MLEQMVWKRKQYPVGRAITLGIIRIHGPAARRCETTLERAAARSEKDVLAGRRGEAFARENACPSNSITTCAARLQSVPPTISRVRLFFFFSRPPTSVRTSPRGSRLHAPQSHARRQSLSRPAKRSPPHWHAHTPRCVRKTTDQCEYAIIVRRLNNKKLIIKKQNIKRNTTIVVVAFRTRRCNSDYIRSQTIKRDKHNLNSNSIVKIFKSKYYSIHRSHHATAAILTGDWYRTYTRAHDNCFYPCALTSSFRYCFVVNGTRTLLVCIIFEIFRRLIALPPPHSPLCACDSGDDRKAQGRVRVHEADHPSKRTSATETFDLR